MKPFFSVATLSALVVASTSAFAANQGETSTVMFKGAIKENTCILNNDSVAQVVELGDVESSVLASTGLASQPTSFTISLDQCDSATASITFSGDTATDEALRVTGGETVASGVGIQILENGIPLKVDGSTSSAFKPVGTGKDNKFNFAARYIALGEKVSPGQANATAQFTVKYE